MQYSEDSPAPAIVLRNLNFVVVFFSCLLVALVISYIFHFYLFFNLGSSVIGLAVVVSLPNNFLYISNVF